MKYVTVFVQKSHLEILLLELKDVVKPAIYQLKENECQDLIQWEQILKEFYLRIPENIIKMRQNLKNLKTKRKSFIKNWFSTPSEVCKC